VGFDLSRVAEEARRAETLGYDGVVTAEAGHDPFLPLLVAAQHTEHLELATGIAVAFGRNPLTVAQIANDLQVASGGRFILGLGSQIRAHITRRYSMPWSHPAARMREFILALRHIWASWHEGEKLSFEGEFYTHTLMTPFFSPGPNEHGAPRVWLAAVGPKMTEVAGETADGILCHPFTTERYLRDATLPQLDAARKSVDRTLDGFEVVLPVFVVTGRDEEEMEAATAGVKSQIAFYGSTPAYRPVLDMHGWGDAQGELNRLSKEGRWAEMGAVIDDEMLTSFAVVAEPGRVAEGILDRYGDVADRVSFYAPYRTEPELWSDVIARLHQG
jgi:probable F420-dependent oxidoreductase